ncbi:MAG TPA: ribonuclease HI family protein [Thermomicrobiales bacterium]|nr:ribonuclease HI family protein [Thermomicrobiales bacterium]
MSDSKFQQESLIETTPPKSLAFEIVFDGGSLGNPGKGYGSFEIMSGGEIYKMGREEYTGSITNNQAEYMTLIESLKWLADDLSEDRGKATVTIHGDSQLVVNQINGTWKVKNARMVPLVDEAKKLFKQFGRCTIAWHPRAKSVERLGH